jgi:hypothetical protein
MKRVTVIIGLTTLLLVGVAAASIPTDHWQMPGAMMMGYYDLKSEVTFKGTVAKIERMGTDHMRGMGGIRLIVKSENETYTVHLGPADFVEKTMTFKEGDSVEVTASRMPMIPMTGETVFMAREVKKGDTVLKLRDENGMPLWPGVHMRMWHS